MKRCPKCNRSYTTDTQKFCTQDGGLLVAVDVGQKTVLMDTAQLDDDAPTKAISRELVSEGTGGFDPFKTVMARTEETRADLPHTTHDLTPPATTLRPTQQTSPGSGQISQPVTPTSAPLPPPASSAPAASGSIETPVFSPQAPTMRLPGSGQIAASAPSPQQPVAQTAQPAQPSTARRAAKKSRLPLVLGILAVLLILGAGGLGVAYFFVFGPMLAARRGVVVEPPRPPANEPTPNIQTTPNDLGNAKTNVVPEPPPYAPPADAVEFVNSKEHLDGQLAEHYVDFSFYYPNRWQKDPTAGKPGARNFAQVERRLPPDFTQENFAVAWNSSAAPVAENRALFHSLAENLSAQFEKKFPGYRKVSEGETKVGVYDGYEFRFESLSPNTAKGDLKLWGRVVFLPPQDGSKNGVTLLMLATSLAPELKTVNDVGKKGELPMLLESFRFGKK
jgi:hypothetical protein